MEAEGGKEGSGTNDWDFGHCGVAAGLGRGGAASLLDHFSTSTYLPTLFVQLSSKLQLPHADVIIRPTKKKTPTYHPSDVHRLLNILVLDWVKVTPVVLVLRFCLSTYCHDGTRKHVIPDSLPRIFWSAEVSFRRLLG
jgi:hypothetical protein